MWGNTPINDLYNKYIYTNTHRLLGEKQFNLNSLNYLSLF